MAHKWALSSAFAIIFLSIHIVEVPTMEENAINKVFSHFISDFCAKVNIKGL